jgi:hypothetical protein
MTTKPIVGVLALGDRDTLVSGMPKQYVTERRTVTYCWRPVKKNPQVVDIGSLHFLTRSGGGLVAGGKVKKPLPSCRPTQNERQRDRRSSCGRNSTRRRDRGAPKQRHGCKDSSRLSRTGSGIASADSLHHVTSEFLGRQSNANAPRRFAEQCPSSLWRLSSTLTGAIRN